MELNLKQKQTQTLSPQMVQSMEILQMGSQELLEYVEELAQENPVLERTDSNDKVEEYSQLKRRLDWLESNDPQNRVYHRQDTEEESDFLARYGTVEDHTETLCEHLLAQLEERKLPPAMWRAAALLAGSLNGNGWLDEPISTLAAEINCPERLLWQALDVVQSLEPAGVAARNLNECLRLQLLRMDSPSRLALRIAENYLEPLAKNRYGLIARELGCTQEQAREACDLIRSLNPRPGSGYTPAGKTVYINPDLIVVNQGDELELLANDSYFPTLHISGYYTRMMKEENDRQVQEYLTDKVRQAKWVVRAIEQRRSTLMSCAQCILDIQEEFFRKGPGHLVPLTLADVASRLDIHESTVSRAVKDKYLQCAMGVFPLTYFFSRGLGSSVGVGEGTSPDAAKALLKQLIAEEDKHRPLSDQQLCQLMSAQGCRLSRRTVAKYRDELNISNTAGRRQHE